MTAAHTARALHVPGARLHHEVRGTGPLVALVGAPMDADAFAPLAELLAVDHTVLTAWKQFFATAGMELPEGAVEEMAGSEQGQRQAADAARWFAHELRHTVAWLPDLDALRPLRSRLVVGIGEDSAGQLCDRTSRALAAGLGLDPVLFPGGYIGFVEQPEAFAGRLCEVLRRSTRAGE